MSDSESDDSTPSGGPPEDFERIPETNGRSTRPRVSHAQAKDLKEYLRTVIYSGSFTDLSEIFEQQVRDLQQTGRVGWDGFLFGRDQVGEEEAFKIDAAELDDWSYYRILQRAKRMDTRAKSDE